MVSAGLDILGIMKCPNILFFLCCVSSEEARMNVTVRRDFSHHFIHDVEGKCTS